MKNFQAANNVLENSADKSLDYNRNIFTDDSRASVGALMVVTEEGFKLDQLTAEQIRQQEAILKQYASPVKKNRNDPRD